MAPESLAQLTFKCVYLPYSLLVTQAGGLMAGPGYGSDELDAAGYNQRVLPAQTSGRPAVTDSSSERSDVYGYGIVLWEMYMYGAQPYAAIEDDKAVSSIFFLFLF